MTLTLLGISGSLRRGSYSTKLLKAARRLAPEGVQVDLFDLAPIPLYNDDVRAEGLPEPVQALREAIRAADGLILATPEYNHSFSGVLKNAIDWASRPPEQPFDGKPIGLISSSPGPLGGVRAFQALRLVFPFLNGRVLNRPAVSVGQVNTRFAEDGTLTDDDTAGFLRQLIDALAAEAERSR
ncbi:NADPH-dependent FMN reductase [Marinivivus vitaminiproducens]|uniref:NADPH-dependent FMN reductase n=1 Tax=Marinivivus vitaminiproducens TaxID=3035935 RepID=UPI00279D97A9|nr:NAD(P)H-dependent oxidoreductase [Geminicoccaceae bacterium SCSIO 64248]